MGHPPALLAAGPVVRRPWPGALQRLHAKPGLVALSPRYVFNLLKGCSLACCSKAKSLPGLLQSCI